MALIIAANMAFIVAVPIAGTAHIGRTDKNGCPVHRKTGERHCHGGRGGAIQAMPETLVRPSGRGAYANCAAVLTFKSHPAMD